MHGLVAAGRTSRALLASQVPVKQSPGAEGLPSPRRGRGTGPARSHLSLRRIGRGVLIKEVSSFICV